MNLHFTIEYKTNWGEEVFLIGNFAEYAYLPEAIPLTTKDGQQWEVELILPYRKQYTLTYYYIISKNNKIIRREWDKLPHQLLLKNPTTTKYRIKDIWMDKPNFAQLYSSAFVEVWMKRNPPFVPLQDIYSNYTIQVHAPQIEANEVLAICGNHEVLGNWDPHKSLLMCDNAFPCWQQNIPISSIDDTLEYKFVRLNKNDHTSIEWEEGPNRVWNHSDISKDTRFIKQVHTPIFSKKRWRAAGFATPVFSLRSKNSWGIGEFSDLKLAVDWAAQTQQKIIQILPVNDTTQTLSWSDSYPYRCISVFALNPVYANLEQLGILETKYKEEYLSLQSQLNEYKDVDFPTVQKKKLFYLKELYQKFGKVTLGNTSYKEFVQNQKEWLLPYSAYCYLRTRYQTANTSAWGKYKTYSKELSKELIAKHKEEIQFYMYIQFHLFRQLKDASDYARQKGIVLKGDLPIGIGLDSVDAWMYPQLFHLNSQAGAPPDAFSTLGQNWAFPTYNWQEMAKDSYRWWRKRLEYLALFFDAYRIDHILGFFRIWSIPRIYTRGIMGQFDPALPFSYREIEEFGFIFKKALFTQPYIDMSMLKEHFGDASGQIIEEFFDNVSDKTFKFQTEYNTQDRLASFFASSNKLNHKEKDFLLGLFENVLFVEDCNHPNHFHPRINGQSTSQYLNLSKQQQQAYDRLYNHFFYERHNEFWKEEAYKKLPSLLSATNMLVCGEDLGMIPKSVPEVMQELSILSLEVARMPKEERKHMGTPSAYPYLSVSSFSTHDMPTLRAWWKKITQDKAVIQEYLDNEKLAEQSLPDVYQTIIAQELNGNSILAIQAIQDWMALNEQLSQRIDSEEEQINTPSNPNNKWKYRIPCYLEEILTNDEFNNIIRILVHYSHRQ